VDRRSAESIGRRYKASGHVLPRQRNIGRVRAVTRRQSFARVIEVEVISLQVIDTHDVPLRFRDALRPPVASSKAQVVFGDGSPAGSRPGAVYLASPVNDIERAVAMTLDAITQSARDEAIADLTSAWQGKPCAPVTSDVHDNRRMTADEAIAARDRAFAESVQELQDASTSSSA
jgi:hypothetical protein